MTVAEVIYVMGNHYNDIAIQRDTAEDFDSAQFIGTVAAFVDSQLYCRVASAEVLNLYSEDNGTIWIRYYSGNAEQYAKYATEDSWV